MPPLSMKQKLSSKLQMLQKTSSRLDQEFSLGSIRAVHETITAQLALQLDIRERIEALEAIVPRAPFHEVLAAMVVLQNPPRVAQASSLEALQNWLNGTANFLSIVADLNHAEGTGEWFLSHETLHRWQESDTDPILWVTGIPGSGKSVLSNRLREHLPKNKTQTIIYCSFRSQQATNPSVLVAYILNHLLPCILANPSDNDVAILRDLLNLSSSYPQGPQFCPFQKLWNAALKTMDIIPQLGGFLIIDALDECSFDDRAPGQQEVLSHLDFFSRKVAFKTAIFSRPLPEFDQHVSSNLCIHMNSEVIASDIFRFVHSRLDQLRMQPERREYVANQVSIKAAGCFLWAKLSTESLNRACTEANFEKHLQENCPFGLERFYDHIIQKSNLIDKMLVEGLFLLLCQAQEPLSIEEIARVLDLGPKNPKTAISEIGNALLVFRDEKVMLCHASVKDYLMAMETAHDNPKNINISAVQSHERLATECIHSLLEEQYASKGRIGKYIRRNCRLQEAEFTDYPTDEPAGISYTYASKYWDFHLTALSDPENDLLRLADKFLHQNQFVFWNEYSLYKMKGLLVRARDARVSLTNWYKELPDPKKTLVNLDDYFKSPYERLSQEYEKTQQDDYVLPWLTLLQLENYLMDFGIGALPIVKRVVKGLSGVLGAKHPLTLHAKTDRAALHLRGGNFQEAYDDLIEIAAVQEETLEKNEPALYKTFLSLGAVEYHMNRYKQSLRTECKAAEGLLRLTSPHNPYYQATSMWNAYAQVELGNLDFALKLLSDVFEERRKENGQRDLFASKAQYSIGSVQRKLRRKAESLDNLYEAFWTHESAPYRLSDTPLLDIGIEILIASRDFGKREDARTMLNRIDREANLVDKFPRRCQVTHVRALLISDEGDLNLAILILQDLVIQADRHMYNRALMWVLLDLAELLERRGDSGDEEQALSNFDNILVDLASQMSSENLRFGRDDEEPDPPRILKLARRVLLLVRSRMFKEVEELFENEKVDWVRPKDIWLLYGNPSADTAWMREA